MGCGTKKEGGEMRKIEELKRGDSIKIHYADKIYHAKVLNNEPENSKIYLSIGYKLFGIFIESVGEHIVRYNGYEFAHYSLINKYPS